MKYESVYYKIEGFIKMGFFSVLMKRKRKIRHS